MKTPVWFPAWLLLLLAIPATGIAQHPPGIIDIEGRVIEQREGREIGVGGIKLFISNYGDFLYTDASGRFAAAIPADGQPFHIEIHHPRYNILTPPGGELLLSEFNTATFKIALTILVRGSQRDTALEQEVQQLNERVTRLSRQKQLSAFQLAKLHQRMLDTILYFQRQQRQWEEQLSRSQNQNQELQQSLEVQQGLIAAQRDSIESLVDQLYVALEEQYLRQQELYERIAAGLKAYRSRAADLNDWLPRLKSYFRDAGAQQDYYRTINAYNLSYNELEKEHEGLIAGVAHYWTDPVAALEVRKVYNLALDKVHRSTIYTGNQSLGPYFEERPPKVNKTQKEADAFHERLSPLIEELDREIDRLLQILRMM